MRMPHLRRNVWVILGLCGAAAAWNLTAKHPDIILPTEWEASSAAGIQAMKDGRHDDAERYFQRALEHASAFADDDPRLGTSLDNLATLRKAQRRHAEAEALYRRALDVFERGGPRSERPLAVVCNDLGTLRAAAGHFDEAEALFRRAIAVNERARGPDDPELATNLRNCAAVLLAQGKLAEAAGAASRASAIEERQSHR